MHRLTARILDVINSFQNTNVPIHEIVCVSPSPYYIDWFETVSTNDFLNTTNNKNAFTELTRVFKEHFEMKVQEG